MLTPQTQSNGWLQQGSLHDGAGVMWVELFMNRRRYRWHVLTTLVLILNTALFIILGFLPLLDNFYHILALGTGALLAPALLRPQVPPPHRCSALCMAPSLRDC